MSRTGQAAVAVKILRPSMVHREAQTFLHMSDAPRVVGCMDLRHVKWEPSGAKA